MRKIRAALSDAIGAQWLAIGAGLLTAPTEVMRLGGVKVEGAQARTVVRILGLRDMVLGAAVLSIEDAPTRGRLQRALAAMALGELVMLLLLRREQPLRTALRLGAATAA